MESEEPLHTDMEKGSDETPDTQNQEEAEAAHAPHARSISFSYESLKLNEGDSSHLGNRRAAKRRSNTIHPFQITGADGASRRTSYLTRTGNTRDSNRRVSSMEMRRLPTDILMKAFAQDDASILSDEFQKEKETKEVLGEERDILHLLCLRPGYTLRTQLMLSFGSISAMTVVAVVTTCIAAAVLAASNVKSTSTDAFQGITGNAQALTARYLAEALAQKILLRDTVNLLHEATQDRFAGYPRASEDDTPFFDVNTREYKYPVDFSDLPLEWQFETNVNADNFQEHFQQQKYYRDRDASTASAQFLFKGMCDPNETNVTSDAYWPNCTDSNNDISTGGIWEPTVTTQLIHDKGKDMVPLLKALFETRDAIRDVGLYFVNDGAGASINYPHYPISTQSTYTSVGCDWMLAPNFFDPSKSIGTPEMIARCSPDQELVSSRIYSALERAWCRDQAINPASIQYHTGPDAWDNSAWLLSMGRSVYDRITNEFIACIYIGISLNDIDEELAKAEVVEGETVSLLEWGDTGTVVGSSVPNRNISDSASIYDLDVGMTKRDYENLLELVDFNHDWDPEVVRSKFSNFFVDNDNFFVTAYPVPPIPDEYTSSYKPVFLVVISTPSASVYGAVNQAGEYVDEKVQSIIIFCLTVGASGLILSLFAITLMADVLTRPLRQMNKIASGIIDSFGDPTKDKFINIVKKDDEMIVSKDPFCSPRTELSIVVKEFNKMVASFSGTNMVKTERHHYQEVYNKFTLHADFAQLYESRADTRFNYAIQSPLLRRWMSKSLDDEDDIHLYTGSNVLDQSDTLISGPSSKRSADRRPFNRFTSPLFLWIVALIVSPLLAVNIIIAAVALHNVSDEFSDGVNQAEEFFLEVEKTRLWVHSKLRADLVAEMTMASTHDLHVLTRYAEWTLFGGIGRSDSYIEVSTGVEECKSYDTLEDCPYFETSHVCDCAWKDQNAEDCRIFEGGSRKLQKAFWACQANAADENGNRLSHSYPETCTSPETTTWWDDQNFVPGWTNSSTLTTGYSTLYERLSAASSIPLYAALYNYAEVKENVIASFVSFESDGLFVGYQGCYTDTHATFASYQSTVENGAALFRPELCPLGKYGYDPRCRGWYDKGRRLSIEENSFLHVTEPYEFAGFSADNPFVAQSATSPLIDPRNGDHIGQSILDFSPDGVFRSLQDDTPLTSGGFPFLITVENAFDTDTVIGPKYNIGDSPISIVNAVMNFDIGCGTSVCENNIQKFNSAVSNMKAGERGNATILRSMEDDSQQILHLAFAPVSVKSFRPVDSVDFSRGVNVASYPIYSLALVESNGGILKAFDPIQEATNTQTRVAIGIVSILLVLATGLVVYISLRLTKSITDPMVYLLQMIKGIGHEEEAPSFRTVKASQEIVNFSDTIEMLSKVVRSANAAFYVGEFERAFFLLMDALRLFRRLENKKAIGIACNNLGNTILAMYQEMEAENLDTLAGFTKRQLVAKGIAYFREAIELGEKAYDEFYILHGWTPICLDFMQHLSNRYFNRGLFLLVVKDVHINPSEIAELGKRDLNIARDMDAEVIAYGEDIGWSKDDRVSSLFETKIVRLSGYNLLLQMGYEDEWEMRDILDETYGIISSENKIANSILFDDVTVSGRMQEIETELVKYYLVLGDIETAARIAIRTLFEDEKIFVDSQASAIEALVAYVNGLGRFSGERKSRILSVLENQMFQLEESVHQQTATSVSEMDSEVLSKVTIASKTSKRCSAKEWSLRQSSGRFVTMEGF